jgi:hypothetical protein
MVRWLAGEGLRDRGHISADTGLTAPSSRYVFAENDEPTAEGHHEHSESAD